MLALKNGYYLDFSKINKEDMLTASLQTFNLDYDFMTALLYSALSKKINFRLEHE